MIKKKIIETLKKIKRERGEFFDEDHADENEE